MEPTRLRGGGVFSLYFQSTRRHRETDSTIRYGNGLEKNVAAPTYQQGTRPTDVSSALHTRLFLSGVEPLKQTVDLRFSCYNREDKVHVSVVNAGVEDQPFLLPELDPKNVGRRSWRNVKNNWHVSASVKNDKGTVFVAPGAYGSQASDIESEKRPEIVADFHRLVEHVVPVFILDQHGKVVTSASVAVYLPQADK